MSDPQLGPIEVLLGPVSPQMAQLYVHVPQLPGGGPWTISGRVRGPRCRHARTLPAQFPLVDLGTGPTLLARSQVTDPCPWSPDLPALYEVNVELRREGILLASQKQEVGIRSLATRGESLYQDGIRRVLRGAECVPNVEDPWSECRTGDIALWMRHPADDDCRAALEEGVRIIAALETDVLAESSRLARWASVALVVWPEDAPEWRPELKKQFPGSLFALRRSSVPLQPPSPAQAFADLLVLEVPGARGVTRTEADRVKAWRKPVLAWRRSVHRQSLSEARRQCDDLQRDLAPHLDCAGYFIGLPE